MICVKVEDDLWEECNTYLHGGLNCSNVKLALYLIQNSLLGMQKVIGTGTLCTEYARIYIQYQVSYLVRHMNMHMLGPKDYIEQIDVQSQINQPKELPTLLAIFAFYLDSLLGCTL